MRSIAVHGGERRPNVRSLRRAAAVALLTLTGLVAPTLSASEDVSLDDIVKRLDALEARNRYLQDYIAITKVQNLYQHYINLNARLDIVSLFADRPDVEIELSNKGVLVGADAPERYFLWKGTDREVTGKYPPRPPGTLILHMAVNPTIEISPDGTRAKAVWLSPGITTTRDSETDEILDKWNYGKYEMGYVKVDGQWKILSFRWHQIFNALYDEGWAGEPSHPGFKSFPLKADRPSAPDFYRPYRSDRVNFFAPPPPEPYE